MQAITIDEAIDSAAIRWQGRIFEGVRHTMAKYKALCDTGVYPLRCEGGFITSRGDFVSRKAAARIAYSAGQIKERLGILYSEDLW